MKLTFDIDKALMSRKQGLGIILPDIQNVQSGVLDLS